MVYSFISSKEHPDGFRLDDEHESSESYKIRYSSTPLVIPLPYNVWFPCIVVWYKALDLLKCFWYVKMSSSGGEQSSKCCHLCIVLSDSTKLDCTQLNHTSSTSINITLSRTMRTPIAPSGIFCSAFHPAIPTTELVIVLVLHSSKVTHNMEK